MKRKILLLFFLVVNILYASEINILFNSDTHGTLFPCDCPKNPAGGISRRAYLIDSLKSKLGDNLLILNGGDFSAGGKYDLYTEGNRKIDSLKTYTIIKALSFMKYDAINIGDEDLIYGIDFLRKMRDIYNLPFISLNIVDKDGKSIFKSFLEKNINNKKILITGIVYIPTNLNFRKYSILPPINELEKLLKTKKDFDYLLILNHCGQDSIKNIINVLKKYKLDEKALIFNGHYKRAEGYKYKIDKTNIINFNYTSKYIHFIKLDIDKNNITYFNLINLGLRIPNSRTIDAILKEYKTEREGILINQYYKTNLDLFIMAHCPFAKEAIKELYSFLADTAKYNWNIYYIFNEENGNLRSLHGQKEVEEDLLQIALQILDKDKYLKFLKLRYVNEETDLNKILAQIGVKKEKLDSISKTKEFNNFLTINKRLIKNHNINASPTLMINRKLFEKPIYKDRVLHYLCKFIEDSSCSKLPECFDDTDCFLPGKISKCLNAGSKYARCVYKNDVSFDFYIIYDSLSFYKYDTSIVSSTQDLFPSVKIKKINASSNLGQKLIKELHIKKLPQYIATKTIRKAENYEKVKDFFILSNSPDSFYILESNNIFRPIDITRKLEKGQVDFYFAPLSILDETKKSILKMAIDLYKGKRIRNFGFFHVIYNPNDSNSIETKEILKLEYLKNKSQKKFIAYLNYILQYGPEPLYVPEFKVTTKEIEKSNVKRNLKEINELFKDENIQSDIYILINNRELLPIGSEEDFFRIISFADRVGE